MHRNLHIILGIIVALLPFVSIPNAYKTWIFVILGGAIAFTSYKEKYFKKKFISLSSIRRGKKTVSVTPIPSEMSPKISTVDEITRNKDTQE